MQDTAPNPRRRWPYVLAAIVAIVLLAGAFDSQQRQTQVLTRDIQNLEKKVESLERELRHGQQ
jgi:outer membrane murein-binding lipoprotein Lpp